MSSAKRPKVKGVGSNQHADKPVTTTAVAATATSAGKTAGAVADQDPFADSGTLCSQCGTSTKRKSGLCRKCDPAKNKSKAGGAKPSVVAGVGVVSTSKGAILDTDQPSITEDEIGQCDFTFVPVYKGGDQVEGQYRQCKNAVRLPAVTCHQHGGDMATSLGRTVAKAKAEAARGECFPLAAEHWDQADERLAAVEGQLLAMLETDTSQLADAYVAFRRAQSEHGVARFSTGNQFLVLVSHAQNIGNAKVADPDFDGEQVWAEAAARASEPHMTAEAWKKHGRDVVDPANSAPTVWWQPGGSEVPEKEPGESDQEYAQRAAEEGRFWRGKHGAHIQYPLSATAGEPFDTPGPVIDSYRPSGYGDPLAARDTMTQLATDMGITVDIVDDKPPEAVAYWKASDSKIVVWAGLGDGDPRAIAHALAHELGHARLGHSTDAQKEDRSPEKEMAAESFAALTCAHHGIDTSDMSAWYVNNWRDGAGVDMKAGGMSALRSAVEAFDDYVTATS